MLMQVLLVLAAALLAGAGAQGCEGRDRADEDNRIAKAIIVAGELGFEPRQAESESAVLPLDDSPRDQTN
jgi:hypothetical protein